MASLDKSLQALSKVLNYQFRDINLLSLSLTHRSMGISNNERLEFLGDALVNLIIAEAVFKKYPQAREGDLSRLRSSLVSGDALAVIAREFDLGQYLYLGQGELKSGGHKRTSILGCTVEAIIGAIYLDSNFECCQKTVLGWYATRLAGLSLQNEYKDSKTQLQEYLQGKGLALPDYTLVKTEGEPHAQTFTIECNVKSLDITIPAKGKSRRKAEKLAAEAVLKEIQNDE